MRYLLSFSSAVSSRDMQGNYRSSTNFVRSNCVVMDVDNDHSDDPAEWITPESLEEEYADIRFAITFSRHHMKQKEGKGPRPRMHVYFEISEYTDAEKYAALKRNIRAVYPFYDDNALDAGRFIYGSVSKQVVWHDGPDTIESLVTSDEIEVVIPEGSRNRTMFRWAVRSMKRYGNNDDSKKRFYREAEKCNPPLSDAELGKIWWSAGKYYEKIRRQPDYVRPEEYNGKALPRWEEPIPFGRYTMAPFPIDTLPEEVAAYASAVAESTQTPVDMAGTVALSMLSVCLQGKYCIRGKSDWTEPLNTYALAIAMPSERKSAVLHLMLRPLNVYETQYNQRNAARVESSKMRRRILERKQKAIEDQISKGKAEQEEADKIAQELADFEEEQPLQLYVDDITTEKLVSVISANHGRAALISSEGGIFDTLAGIYTKNVNIDVMLKGYSGDPIRVDRMDGLHGVDQRRMEWHQYYGQHSLERCDHLLLGRMDKHFHRREYGVDEFQHLDQRYLERHLHHSQYCIQRNQNDYFRCMDFHQDRRGNGVEQLHHLDWRRMGRDQRQGHIRVERRDLVLRHHME